MAEQLLPPPAPVREFGRADNQQFYNTWFKEDPLFSVLVSENFNVGIFQGPMADPLIPTFVYFWTLGRHLNLHPDKTVNKDAVLATAIADMLGPVISLDKILNVEQAARNIIMAANALKASDILETYTNANQASWDEYKEQIDNPVLALPSFVGEAQTAIHAYHYILHLTSMAMRNFSFNGITFVAYIYIAVLKRGEITPAFMAKISDGLNNEYGFNLQDRPEVVKILYNQFGQNINADTIGAIAAHWEGLLPPRALRLKLTIQQIAGSGLTSLSTIVKAMNKYNDFNWGTITRLYPEESADLTTALRTVNNNVNYGFNRDLGVVRSTKYKSFAYISKELLVRVGGDNALNRYQGFVRRVPFHDRVTRMIDEYVEMRNAPVEDAVGEAPQNAALVALREQVGRNLNLDN